MQHATRRSHSERSFHRRLSIDKVAHDNAFNKMLDRESCCDKLIWVVFEVRHHNRTKFIYSRFTG